MTAVVATSRLVLGEGMASTRLHAGQGPVLRGGFGVGGGFWAGLEGGGRMPWVIDERDLVFGGGTAG